MATILVAGAAGFIGSHISRVLLNEGHRVIGVDNFVTGRRSNITALESDNFVFYEADIADPAFHALFEGEHIEYIYHLACPTGVPNLRILAHEMLRACSSGMFNILDLARAHNARVLFTSTAEMYGQPEKSPQDEEYYGNVNPLGERSAYEEGKRFSEAMLAAYVRLYGLNARVVRVFNTYGPNMWLEDRRVIPQFIKSILAEEPLAVYGDGSQTRSHLYVDDLVRGLQIVMEHGVPGEAYNVGSETPMTVHDLALLISELSGHTAGIEFKPHFIEDHRQRRPSVEKVKQLGWRQEVPLQEGLKRMLDLHRGIAVPVVPLEEAAPLSDAELTPKFAAAI